MNQRRLYKIDQGKMIDGVCGGIAVYFGIDVTIIRIVWALITCFAAVVGGIIAYVVCAIIMPRETQIW